MRSMKVLVTGGAGFIGSHVVDRLVKRGDTVRVMDYLQPRVHPKGKPSYIPKDVEFIQADVRDQEALAKAMRGMDIINHQAAYQDYMTDFSTFIHTNSVSLAMMLEIIVAEKLPIRKIVYASSQAAYGEGRFNCSQHGDMMPLGRSVPQLEKGDWEIHCPQCGDFMKWQYTKESDFQPYTAYAMSKYFKEIIGMNLAPRYGIATVGLRYSITHGPRNSPFNAYSGIARIFTQRMLRGQSPIIFEDGNQLRDYVSIYDIVEGNIIAMDKDEANNQVFHVGGGKPISVLEFYRTLARVMDFKGEPIINGEYRYGDTRHTISDVSKLRKLGWEPKTPLEKTLTDYVAWIKEQGPVEDRVTEADKVMREMNVVRKTKAR